MDNRQRAAEDLAGWLGDEALPGQAGLQQIANGLGLALARRWLDEE
jgi:hypothetical protein